MASYQENHTHTHVAIIAARNIVESRVQDKLDALLMQHEQSKQEWSRLLQQRQDMEGMALEGIRNLVTDEQQFQRIMVSVSPRKNAGSVHSVHPSPSKIASSPRKTAMVKSMDDLNAIGLTPVKAKSTFSVDNVNSSASGSSGTNGGKNTPSQVNIHEYTSPGRTKNNSNNHFSHNSKINTSALSPNERFLQRRAALNREYNVVF